MPTSSPHPSSPTGRGSPRGSATSGACPPTTSARTTGSSASPSSSTSNGRPFLRAVQTELPPKDAASSYAQALEGIVLDLAFLGLGGDGHTASLFPGAPSLDEDNARAVAVPAGLPPWVERVTMTIPMLSDAREIVFLAVGTDKADAARRAFGEPPSRTTPASLVRSTRGRTIVILDREAAAELRA